MNEHKIFEYPLIVKEFHLDTFGHMNNATYLKIYEEARWEFITTNNYGLKKVQESKKGPVILELNLKFTKELKNREPITIYSQVQGRVARVMSIKQWIKNAQGEVCSEAEFKVAFFDLIKRKIIDPSPEWLTACGVN